MIRIVPIELKEANRTVAMWHSHHKPVVGHKFSIGATVDDALRGIVIVSRPVSPPLDDGFTREVTRLCCVGTDSDPTSRNVASALLGAATRAGQAMDERQQVGSLATGFLRAEHGDCGPRPLGVAPASGDPRRLQDDLRARRVVARDTAKEGRLIRIEMVDDYSATLHRGNSFAHVEMDRYGQGVWSFVSGVRIGPWLRWRLNRARRRFQLERQWSSVAVVKSK